MSDAAVAEVLNELAALEDPRVREVNERHGDDHGVNLTKLRGVAKSLKTDQELALELWDTDDTAARLVAVLISRPKLFTAAQLDRMLREARAVKVHDWLVNYIVKKGPHQEELRVLWLNDRDPRASAHAAPRRAGLSSPRSSRASRAPCAPVPRAAWRRARRP